MPLHATEKVKGDVSWPALGGFVTQVQLALTEGRREGRAKGKVEMPRPLVTARSASSALQAQGVCLWPWPGPWVSVAPLSGWGRCRASTRLWLLSVSGMGWVWEQGERLQVMPGTFLRGGGQGVRAGKTHKHFPENSLKGSTHQGTS